MDLYLICLTELTRWTRLTDTRVMLKLIIKKELK